MKRHKSPTPRPAQFPLLITEEIGSVTGQAKIYRTPHGHRECYTVEWYEGRNGRQRKTFSKGEAAQAFQQAQSRARQIAKALARGERYAQKLSAADARDYMTALNLVQPLGASLPVAAKEWAQAKKILGAEASLIEAAREHVQRHSPTLPRKRVSQVLEEMLAEKASLNLSERYIRDLRTRCRPFAKRFAVPIGTVMAGDVRAFLDGKRLGARSYNNNLRALRALFEFAKERRYLAADHAELDAIKFKKDRQGPAVEVYTPEQMESLLQGARPNLVPILAIGAFAGLRTAELLRLQWREVKLPQHCIEVTAGKSKTASRRLAPIPDNLAAWLAPYVATARPDDRVWPHSLCAFFKSRKKAIRGGRPATDTNAWKHNALRHSFISYRLAETSNQQQVALEAGNSPTMIFRHYRALVTDAQAGQWFGIRPDTAANVITLKQEAR